MARSRLSQRLEDATTPLTVVAGPAGWGKTTLLADWASGAVEHRPVAWLSVEEEDAGGHFWASLVGALPGVGLWREASAAVASWPAGDLTTIVVPSLLDALADLDHDVVLVVDGYDRLTDPRIHRGVTRLVTWSPPSLRLVLAVRRDPPLPLARLRAAGALTEIRVDDLRLTATEGAHVLAEACRVSLGPGDLDGLLERAEGWPAGLALAAAGVREGAVAPDHLEVQRARRDLADYVTEEVLAGLHPSERRLLVDTAPLTRLSGPLCDRVLETTDSTAVLAALDRIGGLVVPLDGHGEWYRCHRLLREACHHVLATGSPARATDVLGRAATWFLEADPSEPRERELTPVGGRPSAVPPTGGRPISLMADTHAPRLLEPLTNRELTVLRALQGTLSQREISRELAISFNTVKGYTKAVYRKLEVASRFEAVARGRALGLL